MMISALLLCTGWLAAAPATLTQSAGDLATYEAAQAAGRDPEAHIRLALWCEAHGLQAERVKHLAIAVLNEPKNATARGLMGLVEYRGRWQRPEAVSQAVEGDDAFNANLERYHERRIKAPQTAEGQWKLALWCEENQLKDQSCAHLMAVISLDPTRELAWKRLGYKKVDGRWLSAGQLAAEAAESKRRKEADARWKPILERAREGLAVKSRQVEAEEVLAGVTDPRAVPTVCRVFNKGEANQGVAVRLLGQIEAAESSRALAVLAVGSRFAEVRRAAAETLVRRDPRDFAEWLANLMQKPVRYEVRPVAGPGSQGVLFVEGTEVNLKRLYSTPAGPTLQPGDQLSLDAAGVPVATRFLGLVRTQPRMMTAGGFLGERVASNPKKIADLVPTNVFGTEETQQLQQLFERAAAQASGDLGVPTIDFGQIPRSGVRNLQQGARTSLVIPRITQIPVGQMALEAQAMTELAQQQLERDVEFIKQHNAPILQTNERVFVVLKKVAEGDLGEAPDAWKKWATDLRGYAYMPQRASQDPPTVTEQVPLAYQPQAAPIVVDGPPILAIRERHSCFGGGTPVMTLAGTRPIESLLAGDQILTQDTTTGRLSYQPIVAVFHNPPNQTLRIDLGDESIVATGIHRFWKAGRGWTMARELKPGDTVRSLGGLTKVRSVEADLVQPVYNLQVADGKTFLVGRAGTLVHDNSLIETVTEPFDAAPRFDHHPTEPAQGQD